MLQTILSLYSTFVWRSVIILFFYIICLSFSSPSLTSGKWQSKPTSACLLACTWLALCLECVDADSSTTPQWAIYEVTFGAPLKQKQTSLGGGPPSWPRGRAMLSLGACLVALWGQNTLPAGVISPFKTPASNGCRCTPDACARQTKRTSNTRSTES